MGDEYTYEPCYGVIHDDYLASLDIATYLVVVPKVEELESHPLDHVQPRATVVRKPSALKKGKTDNSVLAEEEEEDSDPDALYVSVPDPSWTDAIPQETEQVENVEKTTVYKVASYFIYFYADLIFLTFGVVEILQNEPQYIDGKQSL